MMKDILATQKMSYFCSCDFLLAEMYRCSSGGKKPSRRRWSTEEINRANSLTPGGWLKDSCCLKPWAARDDGAVTQWEAELCLQHGLGCAPPPRPCRTRRLTAKRCSDVLLNLLWNVLDTRRIRHKFKVPRLNSPLLLMISCTASDDILSRLFNVLISIQPRLPE